MAWADYGIIEVRMDATDSHIELVKVLVDPNENSSGDGVPYTREEIVRILKRNIHSVITVRGSSHNRRKGDSVTLYGERFITTEGNYTTKDNLGDLPRF